MTAKLLTKDALIAPPPVDVLAKQQDDYVREQIEANLLHAAVVEKLREGKSNSGAA